jgi:hypothetical protein
MRPSQTAARTGQAIAAAVALWECTLGICRSTKDCSSVQFDLWSCTARVRRVPWPASHPIVPSICLRLVRRCNASIFARAIIEKGCASLPFHPRSDRPGDRIETHGDQDNGDAEQGDEQDCDEHHDAGAGRARSPGDKSGGTPPPGSSSGGGNGGGLSDVRK